MKKEFKIGEHGLIPFARRGETIISEDGSIETPLFDVTVKPFEKCTEEQLKEFKYNGFIQITKPMCNFCKENESVGVYATDHGPFSLAYCEECLNHPNIRTISNALSKYARFGNKAFDEYNEKAEPNIYFKSEYVLLRELIKIITVDDVERIFPKEHGLYSLIIDKITNKTI